MMTRQEIIEAVRQAEDASAAHYAETLAWCEQTGFPLYWIAPPMPRGYGETRTWDKPTVGFERVRHHQKGNGWKANHTS